MKPTPLVSICMVTYNHEKYVTEAIRSALGQSFADLELVVVNDGSTDNTADVIASFTDPRLIVIHQKNQGPAAAANRAIAASRGKYVALFSGDDVCHADRIRRQLDEYGKGDRRILFSQCDFIDDESRPLTGGHFADGLFDFQNRTRPQILAHFFHHGNYLNSITTFTERSIFLEAPYDPCLLQLQDFDVWVRLIRKYDLCVMPEKLLHYRIRAHDGNLSSPKRDQVLRVKNEYYLVLRRFFDSVPSELFREAFAGELLNPDFTDGPEYACEQAFAYGRSRLPLAQLIGVERLHGLLNDPAATEVLQRRYSFDLRRFFGLLGSVDVTAPLDAYYSTLYLDTGAGWNVAEQVNQPACPTIDRFDLTFRIPAGCRPRLLRWDPVELLTCRVRIDAIEMTNAAGQSRSLDPESLETNGHRSPDGTVSFFIADPMYWWPVDGDVMEVKIRGRWETDDPLQTALTQSRYTQELSTALAESQGQLRAMLASPYWRVTAPLRAVRAATRRRCAG